MRSQEKYWDKRIKIWSSSSYRRKISNKDIIEWLAGYFRKPIFRRMEVALKYLGPKIKGKIVADFGCGVGDLCIKFSSYQPKKIIGFDISSVAIKEATKRSKKNINNIIFMQ